MQFGGQRTDMNLKPTGQPDNILIKLTEDVLPQPDAILTHGITPQKSRAEGISEAQFLKYFMTSVFKANTVMVGFNNIRFDDEFMRFALWRNFYDAYEWQWRDNCSKWDLLDMARMMRALRPEGIKWPFAPDGQPTVRLELMASVNKLTHDSVHDALSDVHAEVALARLIRSKQPKLFDYLLNLRDKTKVETLVGKGDPLIYTSGRYLSEYQKTTVAVMVGPRANQPGALMYDLRVDPAGITNLEPAGLAEKWSARGQDAPYFPVKILSYNHCPAIAPLNVLDKASARRLKIDSVQIDRNFKKLKASKGFADRLNAALDIMYPPQPSELVVDQQKVDGQLYDGFVNNVDRTKMGVVRAADPEQLSGLAVNFTDERLKALLPLYKARNFPESLSAGEQVWWEKFKTKRLLRGGQASQAAKYFQRIEELKEQSHLNQDQKYLLEELQLYGQSILPPI